jgi:predicted metal-dependent hydrolase
VPGGREPGFRRPLLASPPCFATAGCGSQSTLERDLEQGLELIRHGEFFAAHEELELAWRAADAAEKDFFQGLVHVAVAWYQAGRGNRVGCERQLEKAARRLAPFAPAHRGVDVERVLGQVRTAASTVAGGSLALPAVRL